MTRELWGFLQSSRAHRSAVHWPLLLLQLTDVAVHWGSASPAPPLPLILYTAFFPLVTGTGWREAEWVSTVELSARANVAALLTLSNVQHLSWAQVLLSMWDAAPGWWACLGGGWPETRPGKGKAGERGDVPCSQLPWRMGVAPLSSPGNKTRESHQRLRIWLHSHSKIHA